MEEGNGFSKFGIIYRVFYTDDSGHNREKAMRLDGSDNEFYFFFNTITKKIEAIPKRFINRMEAIE